MKRIIVMCLLMMFFVVGCDIAAEISDGHLLETRIDGLCYDKDTKIVYYLFHDGREGFMSPYYSKNGRLCKYDDGEIIELKGE